MRKPAFCIWPLNSDIIFFILINFYIASFLVSSYILLSTIKSIIMLNFQTDKSKQTVQTQTRLIKEKHSDQGLHCLQLPLHLSGALSTVNHLVKS